MFALVVWLLLSGVLQVLKNLLCFFGDVPQMLKHLLYLLSDVSQVLKYLLHCGDIRDVLFQLLFNAQFQRVGRAGARTTCTVQSQFDYTLSGQIDQFAVTAIGLQEWTYSIQDGLDFSQLDNRCAFGLDGFSW